MDGGGLPQRAELPYPNWKGGSDPTKGGAVASASAANGILGTGSPVHLKSGRFVYSHIDLTSSGPGRNFAFSRFYNNVPVKLTPSGATYYGPLGAQWGHTYSYVLTEYGANNDVRVVTPDLTALDFTLNTTYSGTGPALDYTLTKNVTSEWTLEHRLEHVKVKFNSSKQAIELTDKYGTESMTWGAPSAGVTVTQVITQITALSGLTYSVTYSSPDTSLSDADPAKRWYIGTVKENVSGREIRYTYLSSELLYEVKDTGINATAKMTHGYNSAGGDPAYGWVLSSVTNRKGQTVFSQSYNTARRLTSQNENSTGAYSYAYHDATSTVTKTSPTGYAAVAVTDSEGRFTSYKDLAGGQFSYTYDSRGNLTDYTDSVGKTLDIEYNGQDRPTSVTEPGSLVTSFEYNANQFLTSETDPGGHETTFEVDSLGNVTARENALGHREEWTYNSRSQVLTYENKRGYTTTYTYNTTNAAGMLLSIRNPLNEATLFEHDSQWRRTAKVAPNTARTTYSYDSANRLTQETSPITGTRSFWYDIDSNVTRTSTYRGSVTEYQYYGTDGVYDVPTTISTPTRMHNKSYDSQGRLTFDGESPHHTLSYDSVGRMIRSTENGSGTDHYTYNAASQVATHTDKEGGITYFSYDSVGRLVRTTFPDSTTERREYTACSQLSAIVAPGGGRTEYTYDAAHRKTSMKDPLNRMTTYAYDDNNNLTSVTLPGTLTWSYTYDALDRKTTETDPSGAVTTYTYSCPCPNPTAITNARNKSWSFEYDLLGRKTAEVDPLNNRWEWTYDADGNMLTSRDPTNATITYTYDSSDRVATVTYPDSTSVTNTYESGEAEIASSEDGSTKQVYAYNTARRLTSLQSQPRGSMGWETGTTVYYTYSANGHETRVATSSQANAEGTNYVRNSRGRITRLDEVINTMMGTATKSTTITYTTDGLPSTILRPNGVTTTVTYTTANEVGSIKHDKGSTIEYFSFTRDSRGNITTKNTLAGAITYVYDVTGRVTSTSGPSESETFKYDAAGNLLTRYSSVTGTVTHTYNDADQLTSSTDNTTYTYNARGDLTQVVTGSTTKSYTYTGARLLSTAALNGTVSVTYTYYPASPLRRTRQVPGSAKQYFILDGPNVFEDHEETSPSVTSAKARYPALDGIDQLHARRELQFGMASTVGYLHGDQLNTVHYISDDSGNVTNTYTYSTFGNLLSSSETLQNRYGFTQREGDTATGLYYYRNRQYMPVHGRFAQRDPIGFEGDGPNRYSYVRNNPIAFVDPTGEEAMVIGGGTILISCGPGCWMVAAGALACFNAYMIYKISTEMVCKKDYAKSRAHNRCVYRCPNGSYVIRPPGIHGFCLPFIRRPLPEPANEVPTL